MLFRSTALTISPSFYSVKVGGSIEEVTVTFDQPVPQAFLDEYVWRLYWFNPSVGTYQEIVPLDFRREPSATQLGILPPVPLGAGAYRLTGNGTYIDGVFYEFSFRDVPNEFLSP